MTEPTSTHTIRITTKDALTLVMWLRDAKIAPNTIGAAIHRCIKVLARNLREGGAVNLPKDVTQFTKTLNDLLGNAELEIDASKLTGTLNLQDPDSIIIGLTEEE